MRLDGPLFRRTLARVTWLSDLPLTHPNSVAYHLISKVAREHGVIVLLSGEGADELFGGYAWAYRRRKRLAALRPWLDRIPPKLREYIALLDLCSGRHAGHRTPLPRPPAADRRADRPLRPA